MFDADCMNHNHLCNTNCFSPRTETNHVFNNGESSSMAIDSLYRFIFHPVVNYDFKTLIRSNFDLCLKHDCFPVLLTVYSHPFIHEANHKVKTARPYKTTVHNTKHLSTWYICSAIFKREER